MNNIQYLHGWKEDLCLKLASGHNCDFNRFFYLNCPSTKSLQEGKFAQTANRHEHVLQLKALLDEKFNEGTSESTIFEFFKMTYAYFMWTDKQHIKSFTSSSIEAYMEYSHVRVRRGEIKCSTYQRYRSLLSTIFNLLDLPSKWFLQIPLLPKNDVEPYEAYSQADLKQLLPFLRSLFKQTSNQFMSDPQKHMMAYKSTPTMEFQWKNQTYKLCAPITKMMTAATYLLSYYTYANTNVLLQLIRPTTPTAGTDDSWYSMPAFKRRAFKLIHIEMGQHTLDIPKYSMTFFNTLLEVSKQIDDSKDALLIQTCVYNNKRALTTGRLAHFNHHWLKKFFSFKDLRGRRLYPIISRFRETGSTLTRHFQGDIAQNVLLDNAESVRRKHYSTGNLHDNLSMTQDSVLIRQQQAIDKSSAKAAQDVLKIEVLTIEASQKLNFPQLSRTPNGGSCADPFGEKSKKFNRKANQRQLSHGEKLACADLLKCFGCPSQVIVNSISDIWCLLSFKECIEESLYLHLDSHHYRQNFEGTIKFIEVNIFPKLDKNILKKAEGLLDTKGRHPSWAEAVSVIPMSKSVREIAL